MSLAEAKVGRRQQVAECNTAMEHPLSQVTTTKFVCVRTRAPVCVCARVCFRMSASRSLTLITRIVPLVSAMTVIVIAAAFCSSANRSVMSSRAAAETTRLFRNGHQKVFNTTQPRVSQTERVIAMAVVMFYFNHFVADARLRRKGGGRVSSAQ